MKDWMRHSLLVLATVPAVLLCAGLPRVARPTAIESPEAAPFPTLLDGRWRLARLAVELDAPAGWQSWSSKSREDLCLDPNALYQGSLNAMVLPNLFGKTLAGLGDENRDWMLGESAVTPLTERELVIAGRPALRFEYLARPQDAAEELRVICLVWLQGKQQVILTSQAPNARWPELGPTIEAALGSITGLR
jgi:hypothetical protein